MNKATETQWGWIWASSLPCYRRFRMKSPHLSLGRWGEWLALIHLRRLGWDLVARNWKTRQGEIDLIAYDGPYLVFAEVKTRRFKSQKNRFAEHNFNSRKGRKMEQLAMLFCRRRAENNGVSRPFWSAMRWIRSASIPWWRSCAARKRSDGYCSIGSSPHRSPIWK